MMNTIHDIVVLNLYYIWIESWIAQNHYRFEKSNYVISLLLKKKLVFKNIKNQDIHIFWQAFLCLNILIINYHLLFHNI